MLKERVVLAALHLAVALFGSLEGAAFAQEGGFAETFNDANLPGWERHPKATSVVDGVLQINAGGFALHFGDWSDITLKVKVRLSGEGEAAIRYYFRDAGHYILTLSIGRLSLNKEQNQTSTVLGNADVSSLQSGTWLNIKVMVSQGQHQVFVNDELQITATDPDPLETGAVMLVSQGGATVEFDDLDVRGTSVSLSRPKERPRREGNLPPRPRASGGPPRAAGTAPTPQPKPGNLIQEFFSSQASTIELTTFLINLLLAAICAYILSVVYVHWGSSLTNRRKFAANFLLMTVTTTFIIMVVRSSVALSLGLVGALSIVRFRAAVKEPEELAYLFLAIGVGIGLGDNQRLITLIAMAVGIVLIGLRQLLGRKDADVNLHLSVASHNPAKVTLEQIMDTLREHTAKLKLLRFDETAEALEAAFLIEFRHTDQLNEARNARRALSDSLEIMFMDNKGLW